MQERNGQPGRVPARGRVRGPGPTLAPVLPECARGTNRIVKLREVLPPRRSRSNVGVIHGTSPSKLAGSIIVLTRRAWRAVQRLKRCRRIVFVDRVER